MNVTTLQQRAKTLFGLYFLTVFLTVFGIAARAQPGRCLPDKLESNPRQVLTCFLSATAQTTPITWSLLNKERQGTIDIYRYQLTSQVWPDRSLSLQGKPWLHTLTVYVPDQVQSKQSLLILNGGTRYPAAGLQVSKADRFDPLTIAQKTLSTVISLEDLPNQYLRFEDNIERREDGIIAYTWNRYMDQPGKHAYWPGHLPMVRGAIAAMDATQRIALEQGFPAPEHFIVTGASKRGWAAWLTALADERVNGLIPVVIDILDTKNTLQHIYRSLQGWPMAFRDYIEQDVTTRINTPEFDKLMQIVDPLSYMAEPHYASRLSIPKYLISASGDDFFVTDSLQVYLHRLPGETTLRVLPNQRHYVDPKLVNGAIIDFYQLFFKNAARPTIQWEKDPKGALTYVKTSFCPKQLILWQAMNPKGRDFRLASGIRFSPTPLTPSCTADTGGSLTPISFPNTDLGYQASFVEAQYELADQALTLTTPVFVTPSHYPGEPKSEDSASRD